MATWIRVTLTILAFMLIALLWVSVIATEAAEEDTSPIVLRIKDGDEFIEFTLDEVRTFRTWWSAWNE